MLPLTVSTPELWDEVNERFIPPKNYLLTLEHSLVSLSKWESKWCKPFLTKTEKTFEETIDYIKCMTITQNVKPEVYDLITDKHIEQVNAYIAAPMTATWFSDEKNAIPSREQITAELIYYWMIELRVPVEFQKWHLNKLLTLIKVCNVKNQPKKKMSKKEILARNAKLNEERLKRMQMKG